MTTLSSIAGHRTAGSAVQDQSGPYGSYPPLRADPFTPEEETDRQRVHWVTDLWHSMDDLMLRYERLVEENVRMLAGEQWLAWSSILGQYINIGDYLTEEERQYRQLPVVNRLLYWYMLTISRMTEGVPVTVFQPATLDRLDAELAEVCDPIIKTVQGETGFTDKLEDVFGWVVAGGEGYLKTIVDAYKGDAYQFLGPAIVPVEGPEGVVDMPLIDEYGEMLMVPYDATGIPLVEQIPQEVLDAMGDDAPEGDGVLPDGLTPNGIPFRFTGDPHHEYEGGLRLVVGSGLEFRGQPGPRPWHEKRWHIHKSYLEPEEVFDTYRVSVDPDSSEGMEDSGELARVMFGSGYFGSVEGQQSFLFDGADRQVRARFLPVYELWHAPSAYPGMERTADSPGGRLCAVTPRQVLRDGPRPGNYKYTSPIRQFSFVKLPGRPRGTTPQEMLNPLQRAYNRGWAQFMEHRALCTNPVALIDTGAGIEPDQIVSEPGLHIFITRRSNIPPIEYVEVPQLGADAYRIQQMLGEEFRDLGNIVGAEGRPPDTNDPPAALAELMKANSDRFIGPTMRRAAVEVARWAEDVLATIEVLWDEEKVVSYAGEDQAARTITVYPEMFRGRVNVIPDTESMLPESRAERQARVDSWLERGLLGGDPTLDPGTSRRYFDLIKYPHLGRAARPGGIDRVTAEQENALLLQGQLGDAIAVFPWYDHQLHLLTHYEYMKSPEYLKLPLEMQNEFVVHVQRHEQILQQQQIAEMEAAIAQEKAMAAATEPDAGGDAPPGGQP